MSNTDSKTVAFSHTSYAAAVADLKKRKEAAGLARWDAGEGKWSEGYYCAWRKRVVFALYNRDGSRCC